MDIPKIILTNTKNRYLLELQYTEDETIKQEILNIISKLDKPFENKIETFDNKINELEKLSMKKQFYRLKLPQKITLLKDYFTKQNILNNDNEIIQIHKILEPVQDKIQLIHLNDSYHQVGQHIDRHEQIGQGYIKIDQLIKFIFPYRNVPMILETKPPYDKQIALINKIK